MTRFVFLQLRSFFLISFLKKAAGGVDSSFFLFFLLFTFLDFAVNQISASSCISRTLFESESVPSGSIDAGLGEKQNCHPSFWLIIDL